VLAKLHRRHAAHSEAVPAEVQAAGDARRDRPAG
jgi:hypothetical protein